MVVIIMHERIVASVFFNHLYPLYHTTTSNQSETTLNTTRKEETTGLYGLSAHSTGKKLPGAMPSTVITLCRTTGSNPDRSNDQPMEGIPASTMLFTKFTKTEKERRRASNMFRPRQQMMTSNGSAYIKRTKQKNISKSSKCTLSTTTRAIQ
ncbi:hypothetical protein BJV82DRAFT_612274 [Fennellomyces sp. T-0311]|nr:hypothetical protein BJV82DRAFT_612274 [Fennellomyces sp. T-0311]